MGASQTPPSPALAPPPGNPRFPQFDGLRALAVLGVLALHASELTAQLGFGLGGRFAEVAGGVAVIMFFAISGFLLYRPFVAARAQGAAPPSIGRYARRRILRVVPGYWTALTLLAIYPGITDVFTHDWWRYYGYLQVYSDRTATQGIPVAWTLCVEVSFYVALPAWAYAVRRLRVRSGSSGLLISELVPLAVVALAGAVVTVAGVHHSISAPVSTSLPGECIWLAIGMALAVLSTVRSEDDRRLRWVSAIADRSELCWAVAAAAVAGLMALVPSGGLFGFIPPVPIRQALARIALQAIVVSCLVAPAALGRRRGFPGALLSWAPLAWLGTVSYSFYLWHLTIVELLAGSAEPGAFSATGWNLLAHVHAARTLVLFVAALAITGAVATLSYRLVELPFLLRKG